MSKIKNAAEKGLMALKSYGDINPFPAARKQYIAHTGTKARIRYLRQECKQFLESKDFEVKASLDQARETVKGKFEEYGLLMMVFQAKDISESTGVSFIESLDYIVDKIKTEQTLPSSNEANTEPSVGNTDLDPNLEEMKSDVSRTGDEVAVVDPGTSPTNNLSEV